MLTICSGNLLPVQGVDSHALEAVVTSWYRGTVVVSPTTIAAVFDAASKLESLSVAEECKVWLAGGLTVDNCCTVLQGVLVFKHPGMMQPCLDFVLQK